jgi:hypothetical protein
VKISNTYPAQAAAAERFLKEQTALLPTIRFEKGGVHMMRFPENEVPHELSLEAVRILQVETGHVLIWHGRDTRTWMSKEDAVRRCYDALRILSAMPSYLQIIPKEPVG